MCETCGKLGDCNGTIDKCANCWEVEKRLTDYLKSEFGREFVGLALMDAMPEEQQLALKAAFRFTRSNVDDLNSAYRYDDDENATAIEIDNIVLNEFTEDTYENLLSLFGLD